MALAHLHAAGIAWDADLPPVAACPDAERRLLASQLATGTACVPTTSMGRLFDAVASLLGIRHESRYEAEAAMALELAAMPRVARWPPTRRRADSPAAEWQEGHPAATERQECRPADTAWGSGRGLALTPRRSCSTPGPVLRALVDGLRDGVSPGALAYAFHVAVADAVVEVVDRVAGPVRLVGLTGGVFQNVLLLRLTRDRLTRVGFTVLTHRTVPPNDGGLALGQAAVSVLRALDEEGPDMDDALAADLASTALASARRFHAGATMWCLAPRWEPHAQHVAVEFVHPVIVGKRALPAVALTGPDLVATARISIRPGDLVARRRRQRPTRTSARSCGGPRPGAPRRSGSAAGPGPTRVPPTTCSGSTTPTRWCPPPAASCCSTTCCGSSPTSASSTPAC